MPLVLKFTVLPVRSASDLIYRRAQNMHLRQEQIGHISHFTAHIRWTFNSCRASP